MPKYLYAVMLTLTLLAVAACNIELPLPSASDDKKVVLLGELNANDSMFIRAGQSSSLNNGGSAPPLIQDLQIVAQDPHGVSTALEERADFNSYFLFTVPFSSAATVAAGNSYRITAKHPQLGEVMAPVTIPNAFSAVLTGIRFSNYSGDSVLVLDIDINDPHAANASYVIEALKQSAAINGYFFFAGSEFSIAHNRMLYDSLKSAGVNTSDRYDTTYSGIYSRHQMYTTDEYSDNAGGSGQGKLYKRIFLLGKSFGGSIHHTQILIPRNAIYGEQGKSAQTVIKIKSVAADYYTFLKAYEQYDPSTGIGGNANPANLPGNVQGGFGMVGGVYCWKTRVLY